MERKETLPRGELQLRLGEWYPPTSAAPRGPCVHTQRVLAVSAAGCEAPSANQRSGMIAIIL